jgi:hypothetical protein
MHYLTDNDLRYVVERLPRDIRQLLTENPRKLFLGGGFIRAIIAGEEPSDIDLFGPNVDFLNAVAALIKERRGDTKVHTSKNAITVLTANRIPVQLITRWLFDDAKQLVGSFDFTVCQAAVWRAGNQCTSPWQSEIGASFYIDLAGRRLVYTSPVREEEAGGSLLRVIKYVRRGYSIQVTSLGAVIARLAFKARESGLASTEEGLGQVFAGLLREVDPLMVVDGLDVVDDHEPLQDEAAE